MADLLPKIVDVVINRQTTVPSMKSFSEHLFVDSFDPAGTKFETKRVLVIGDPEELINAGLDYDSVPYKAAMKQFMQNPRIGQMYIGVKRPNDANWTAALSAIKKENNGFYAVTTSARSFAEQQEIAHWVESNKKLGGIESGDSAITDEATGDIGSYIKLNNMDRSFVFFHPGCAPGANGKIADNDPFPAVALFGKNLTYQPGSATWMFKDVNGVPTYELENDQFETATKKNVLLYCSVADVPTTFWGKVGSGEYIDIIHGCDWLEGRIQNRVFATFKKNKKISFNDRGITVVKDALMFALQEGIDVAELLDSYTVSAPERSNVPSDDVAKRNLPNVTAEAPLQGAIHTTKMRVTVTL
ncbi:MAG: DUF3383 domain-containing protein [Treponema sp.]|jgi:hypothetical protein|nr:DUF3383 domain-containing protein [Treponema sp.]